MRALWLVFLAACELEPAPKPKPAPPPPPPPAPVVVAPTPDAAVAEAPPVDAGMDVSDDCVKVGSHVAELLIADAKDAAQKSMLEQEKVKIVRRTAEDCTRRQWSADAIKCFTAGKTMADLHACEKRLPAPPPAANPPAASPPEPANKAPNKKAPKPQKPQKRSAPATRKR